jgi:hypothetical protein
VIFLRDVQERSEIVIPSRRPPPDLCLVWQSDTLMDVSIDPLMSYIIMVLLTGDFAFRESQASKNSICNCKFDQSLVCRFINWFLSYFCKTQGQIITYRLISRDLLPSESLSFETRSEMRSTTNGSSSRRGRVREYRRSLSIP